VLWLGRLLSRILLTGILLTGILLGRITLLPGLSGLLLAGQLSGVGLDVLLGLDDLGQLGQCLLGLIALRLRLLKILSRLIQVLLSLGESVGGLLLLLAGLRVIGGLRVKRVRGLSHVAIGISQIACRRR
jgi:hypothetical protein